MFTPKTPRFSFMSGTGLNFGMRSSPRSAAVSWRFLPGAKLDAPKRKRRPMEREAAVALLERLAADGVDGDVHAAAVGEAHDRRLEVLGVVVDAVRDARLLQAGVLGRAGRADDLGAAPAAQLERRLAHAARGRVHQHALAAAHVAQVDEHDPGGEVVHRDRRGLLEREPLGHGDRLPGRHADRVAVAAEAAQGEDARALGDGARRSRPGPSLSMTPLTS